MPATQPRAKELEQLPRWQLASSLQETPGRPVQKQAQPTWSGKIRPDHPGLCACVRLTRSIPEDADAKRASASAREKSHPGCKRLRTVSRRMQIAAGPDGDPMYERIQPGAAWL